MKLLLSNLAVLFNLAAPSVSLGQEPARAQIDDSPSVACGVPNRIWEASDIEIREVCLLTSETLQSAGAPVQILRLNMKDGTIRDYILLGFFTDQKESLEANVMILRSSVVAVTGSQISRSYIYMAYDRTNTSATRGLGVLYGTTPDNRFFHVAKMIATRPLPK